MTGVEKQFQEKLVTNYKALEDQGLCRATRFLQTIEKYGALKTAKEILRRKRMSDDFEKIAEAGYLKMTMEAMVVDITYAQLFTDEEVNDCYDMLCEYGYYSL